MAFSYDPTTPRGQVRLLIHDTDVDNADNQFFQDAEIDAFLTLNGQNVRLAAAQALDSLAADQAMTLKVIRVLDLQTDGAAVARELRQQAHSLRAQAEQGLEDFGDYAGLFDWAEMAIDPFQWRERMVGRLIDEVP